jgi:hypothetical protein
MRKADQQMAYDKNMYKIQGGAGKEIRVKNAMMTILLLLLLI